MVFGVGRGDSDGGFCFGAERGGLGDAPPGGFTALRERGDVRPSLSGMRDDYELDGGLARELGLGFFGSRFGAGDVCPLQFDGGSLLVGFLEGLAAEDGDAARDLEFSLDDGRVHGLRGLAVHDDGLRFGRTPFVFEREPDIGAGGG